MKMTQVMLDLGVEPDQPLELSPEEIESQRREKRFAAFRMICAQQNWTPKQLGDQPTEQVLAILKRTEESAPPAGVLAGFVTEFVACRVV